MGGLFKEGGGGGLLFQRIDTLFDMGVQKKRTKTAQSSKKVGKVGFGKSMVNKLIAVNTQRGGEKLFSKKGGGGKTEEANHAYFFKEKNRRHA